MEWILSAFSAYCIFLGDIYSTDGYHFFQDINVPIKCFHHIYALLHLYASIWPNKDKMPVL